MSMKAIAIGMAAALVLSGCATNYRDKTPAEVAQATRVHDSEYSESRIYLAPPVTGNPVMGMTYEAQLAAIQSKKDGSITHALRVKWSYLSHAWMFFSNATLPGPIPLETVSTNREVYSCRSSRCSYYESTSAVVPLEILANAGSGLKVRFSSQQGAVIVELPASYVLGYLQAMSTALGGAVAPAAAAPDSRIPKWEAVPTRPAGQPGEVAVNSKEQQIQELQNTQGLSYEEYQRRYRLIMGQ